VSALADRPFQDLLNEVAAERAAPGGGASSAWGCALAAGLVEMAAGFTIGRSAYAERHARMEAIRDRAARLRVSLLELAERDLTAYVPVLEALRLPAGDPDREARLDAALSAAAETPLAVAEAAAEVAELAAETACEGNTHLRGDAVTGALLAEATCRSAGHLVETNLAGRPEDVRLAAVAALTERAAAARAKALA
jgi:formiminotetrahydrofolate cyclodeaminase